MGASGSASERIQQRQDKGDRSLLNTLHGSRGQDGRGETVGHEAMARGHSYRVEGGSMGKYRIFLLLVTAWL